MPEDVEEEEEEEEEGGEEEGGGEEDGRRRRAKSGMKNIARIFYLTFFSSLGFPVSRERILSDFQALSYEDQVIYIYIYIYKYSTTFMQKNKKINCFRSWRGEKSGPKSLTGLSTRYPVSKAEINFAY